MCLYLFVAVYLGLNLRRKELDDTNLGIVAVAGYGFALYLAAFRIIEGGQVDRVAAGEDPLFFLLERVYAYLLLHHLPSACWFCTRCATTSCGAPFFS